MNRKDLYWKHAKVMASFVNHYSAHYVGRITLPKPERRWRSGDEPAATQERQRVEAAPECHERWNGASARPHRHGALSTPRCLTVLGMRTISRTHQEMKHVY